VITIDDILFVHGGISPKLIQHRLSVDKINHLFCSSIIGREIKEEEALANTDSGLPGNSSLSNEKSDNHQIMSAAEPAMATTDPASNFNSELLFLVQDDGPVWYRGYFTNPSISDDEVSEILEYYDKKYVVVGHTTSKDIKARYGNRVFGVDAGIERGREGIILLYKEGEFYECFSDGSRLKY
jgi:hypothetical protein